MSIPSLACSHTTDSKSFVLEYYDFKTNDTLPWWDWFDVRHDYFYHRYCDPNHYNTSNQQNMCNFNCESGWSPNWAFDACQANQGQPLRTPDGQYNPNQTWCGISPEYYNCNAMIENILNGTATIATPSSKNELIKTLSDIGCNVSLGEDGRTKSNCVFKVGVGTDADIATSDYHPKVSGWGNLNIFVRKDLKLIQTCTVAPGGTDPSWKPFCCNINQLGTELRTTGADDTWPQINPITQFHSLFPDGFPGGPRSITGKECDVNWCVNDPNGECADLIVASCSGTSSCNRHYFLSRYNPAPYGQGGDLSTARAFLLLNNISITSYLAGLSQQSTYIKGIPAKGILCNTFYNKTRELAQIVNTFSGAERSGALKRVREVQTVVSAYCANPTTRGSGECACLRGYQSLASDFAGVTPIGESSITFFSKPTSFPGFSRRIDIHCDPRDAETSLSADGGQTWDFRTSGQYGGTLTYPDPNNPGQLITYSNACNRLLPDGQYPSLPGSVQYPTLNPMDSILANKNYGDVMRNRANNPSGLPYRCWLPACTNPNTLESVFSDLLSSSITCPSVCYAYSGAAFINVNEVDANVLSMGNFMQECNFDGNEPKNFILPFLLPGNVANGFMFDVPQGYDGSLTLIVQNSSLDVSSVALSKTVYVASEIPSIISVSPNESTLYIHSLSNLPAYQGVQDKLSLTVYINAKDQNVKYMQTNIWLSDNLRGVQNIPLSINIHSSLSDPNNESNWPQACFFTGELSEQEPGLLFCNPVDCSFGSNSSLSYGVGCPNTQQLLGGVGEESLYQNYFRGFLSKSRNLLDTGYLNQDNVPMVMQYVEQGIDTAVPVQSIRSVAQLGFQELLNTHVQLFGPTISLLSASNVFQGVLS
jgi:hypothetical protein